MDKRLKIFHLNCDTKTSMTQQSTNLRKNYLTSDHKVCKIRKIQKSCEDKNIKLSFKQNMSTLIAMAF